MNNVSFSGNVAYGKPTMQVGTYSNYTSEKAVDGIIPKKDTEQIQYCAHPAAPSGQKAWFYVDLEDVHRIINVTIFNALHFGSR